jgi:hypothetical protein
LVDQNDYKKGVYSAKNSGHFQLFYFSKTLMYASVDNLPYCWLLLELDFAREK